MEPTARPWNIENEVRNYQIWIEAHSRSICRIDLPDDEDKANAELIVRAVNSHDALIAAVKSLIEFPVCCVNTDDPDWHAEDCRTLKAREALRLAGE